MWKKHVKKHAENMKIGYILYTPSRPTTEKCSEKIGDTKLFVKANEIYLWIRHF